MGDDATLLLGSVPSSGEEVCKGHLKERGGPWEFPHAHNLFGRECGSTLLSNIFVVVLVVKYSTEWGPPIRGCEDEKHTAVHCDTHSYG